MFNGHQRWLLSGGIGSGKSFVRSILGEAGWHDIDADAIGHRVIQPHGPAFKEVAKRWPDVVVDNTIDRAALGRIVFVDSGELEALERISHPHIFGTIEAEIQRIDGPVVVEIPLLKNPLGAEWKRMVVDTVDQSRVRRLLGRGMPINEVKQRMGAQPTRGEWLAAADLVLPNTGSLDDLKDCVGKFLAL